MRYKNERKWHPYMAKIYRTPDLLKRLRMVTKTLADNETNVPNVEYTLLQTVDKMVAAEKNKPVSERKPLTQTNLIKEAEVGNSAIKTYEYIFKDLLPLINKYELEVVPKDDDEKNIPSFDTLESDTIYKTFRFMNKTHDTYWDTVYDDLDEELKAKIGNTCDSLFAYADGRWVHNDFSGKNINEIFDMVCEKYQRVQELKAEYESLKKEFLRTDDIYSR